MSVPMVPWNAANIREPVDFGKMSPNPTVSMVTTVKYRPSMKSKSMRRELMRPPNAIQQSNIITAMTSERCLDVKPLEDHAKSGVRT